MPRSIHRLTARQVQAAKGPAMLADGGGLYLQVTAAGGKSWIFRYTGPKYERDGSPKLGPDGKQRRGLIDHGLGSARDVSLSSARTLADDCRAMVKAGSDPVKEKKAERQRQAASATAVPTFRECAGWFIDTRRKGWKNPKSAAQWESSLETYAYPVIGKLAVDAIDVNHVLRIIEPIWATKNETAKRVQNRIENILDYATARKLRAGENPARWRGNLNKLLAPRELVQTTRNFPALPYAEVGAFMEALRAQEGMAARALELLILTATRTSEVLGARWDEIDFDAEAWTVPANRMKARKEHRVPLSPDALAILETLKESRINDYVFPGAKPKRPLSNMAMLALLKRMKRGDLTAHGFRSTFRDWAAETTSYPNHVAEMALAHSIRDSTEKAYRRGNLFEKRRRLMNDWATYCATVATEAGGSVVGIGR